MATLLIDADILLYRALSSVEREIEWETDIWSLTTDLGDAREAFDTQYQNIIESSPIKNHRLVFTDSVNFRKEMNPTYKGNRANVRKPMCLKVFKEEVIERYEGVTKPTLEADDVIGILATKPGNDFIISSADKDLRTIPGKHLINGEVILVTEAEANKMFYTQTLTGDTADGYPGCPGIGKVKAEKIIGDETDEAKIWALIVEAYQKAELTEEDAILQARMARILRWNDWDQAKQEVKLWTPNFV